MSEIVPTTWSPDTCGCTVVYTWDRDSDEDERVHTFSEFVSKCDAHANFTGAETDEDLYKQVLFENQTKNQFLHYLADQAGVANDKGDVDYKDIAYSFDVDRVLNVELASVQGSKLDIDKVQSHANSAHGVGKILVV